MTYLQSYLNIQVVNNSNMDFHRVVYHYEYEHQKNHAIKMDNYVALYGFLRAVTLIFNCLFIYLLFIAISTIDCDASIDWKVVRLLSFMLLLSYLFFMGFMKFYRRFTLESFMCLVIDKSYIENTHVPLSNSSETEN